ncbi:hypothetical protein [Natrarchaeobius halalkaliphilus]|nr:hypothetical protein [Natrarchaeobius halalkaliphilus]
MGRSFCQLRTALQPVEATGDPLETDTVGHDVESPGDGLDRSEVC